MLNRIFSLEQSISNLSYDHSYLRHLMKVNSRQRNLQEMEPDSVPVSSLQEDLQRLIAERNFLVKEMTLLIDENEDIYSSIQSTVQEREEARRSIEQAEKELDTCKSVIDFLVLERDKLKQELETKNQLLETYKVLFNKDNMLRFQQLLKKFRVS